METTFIKKETDQCHILGDMKMRGTTTQYRTAVQQMTTFADSKRKDIREGTFFLGGGGLGPQRGGSSVKVSTKRGGPYLM